MPSTRLSHSRIWFQLAKSRLTHQTFISTLIRRQVVEKWRRCRGRANRFPSYAISSGKNGCCRRCLRPIFARGKVVLAPAIATLRRDLRPSGEESGRSVSGGTATRRIRRALVVTEFALAIVLLVGAGLLVRSWWYVTSIDPGFKPERVLVIELSTPTTFSVPAQRSDLYQRVLEQIQAVPGVENAGIIGDLFIANSRDQVVTIEGDDGTVSERLRL